MTGVQTCALPILVNGEIETRRGRKLYDGDEVEFDGDKISIQK